MTKQGRRIVRKPATKFGHLQKKLGKGRKAAVERKTGKARRSVRRTS